MIPFIENEGAGSLPQIHSPRTHVFEVLLVVVSIAGYAVVSVVPVFTQSDSRVFTEPFRYFVLGLTFVVLFKVRKDSFRQGVNLYLVLFGGLWYLLFLRILWQSFYPMYLAEDKTLYELFQFSLGGTFLPALAILLRGKAEACSTAGRLLAIVLPLSCLLVLYCSFFIAPAAVGENRLSLPTLNPISIGHLGVTTLVIAVWRRMPPTANLSGRTLAIAWKVFSAVLGLVLLGLSASKGPIVAMLGVAIVAVLGIKGSRVRIRMGIRAVIVIAVGVLILLAIEQETQFKPLLRITDAMNPAQASEQDVRGEFLMRALSQFLENPLFGSGLVERESGDYPHNIVVESLMVAGIPGGALCIALLVLVSIRAWQIVVSGGEFAWIGLLFVQRLISVQFSGSLYTASEFWTSAVLVVAVASSVLAPRTAASLEVGPGTEDVSIAGGHP